MKKRLVRKAVLKNGIRVVTEEVPFVKSVSLGVWIEVGSRDEEDGEAGISHFLEHMMFKGTARRSAQDIAREIDLLGGELNAFTSREGTTFYTKVTSRDLSKAVNLLADLLKNSLFKPVEINREKRVVLEEIKMVEDDPEDLVHDLHVSHIWSGHPLSYPILGDPRNIRAISRKKLFDFMDRKYLPQRMVISVAGSFSRPVLMKQLHRVFGSLGKGTKRKAKFIPQPVPRSNGFRFSVERKELEQVHLCMGLPGLPLNHRDRFGAHALNALLGGGMSSRLFQEIREKRGLAYSVYSNLLGYRDAGLLTIYAAASPRRVRKVIRLVIDEIDRIRRKGVTSEELKRAVNHLKGNILMGLESTNNRMNRLAREEIYFGRHVPMEEVLRDINRVSKKQVKRLAEELFDLDQLSMTVLGPVSLKPSQLEKFVG